MSAIEDCIESVARGGTILMGGRSARDARAELAALREVAEAEQRTYDALIHAVQRNHLPSDGCDGCTLIRRVVSDRRSALAKLEELK